LRVLWLFTCVQDSANHEDGTVAAAALPTPASAGTPAAAPDSVGGGGGMSDAAHAGPSELELCMQRFPVPGLEIGAWDELSLLRAAFESTGPRVCASVTLPCIGWE